MRAKSLSGDERRDGYLSVLSDRLLPIRVGLKVLKAGTLDF